MDWQLVWVYFVQLPLETGQSRGDRADATSRSLFVLAALFGVVGVMSVVARGLRGGRMRLDEGVALPLVLSVAFMLMCGGFSTLTLNEPTEGMPLFFASVGLFQIAVVRMLPAWPLVGRVSVASVGGALIAALALIAGWSYNTQVDERRSASNIIFDQTIVEDDLPPALASMRFQVPGRYEGLHAADVRRVVSLLRSEPGNFVQVGDTTILSGLTDKPSVFPALFLSVGLTIPTGGTSELSAFEQRLFDRLETEDVRRVVLERHTWEGASVKNLPRFSAWLQRCRVSRRSIGFFDVIELSRRKGCAQASAE